ncbi:MAG: TetR/AcrR family transcriptional regulator [bacterium]|nr:TetR/AcrR family transcriptional regulator [bacterium]
MKSKSYHHGDLKNSLVKTGIEIISKEGIHNLSIRNVAQKNDVSHTATYRHFKNKEELIAAIAEQGVLMLAKEFDKVIKKHPDDYITQLKEVGWAYIKFALDYVDYYRIIFGSYITNREDHPSFQRSYNETFMKLFLIVQQGQAKKKFKKGDTRAIAVSAWVFVHGYSFLLIEKQIEESAWKKTKLKNLYSDLYDLWLTGNKGK